MPFSSFSDPADLQRAQDALNAAWAIISTDINEAHHEREKTRLVYIVAAAMQQNMDKPDLVQICVERYREG